MLLHSSHARARLFKSILAASFLAQFAIAPQAFAIDCSQQGGGSPARIVVVDGLDFACSFLGIDCGSPDYYLEDVLESLDLVVTPSNIHTFAWSRNALASNAAIADLRTFLQSHHSAARDAGQRLIIVSHSWGTFLAYYALSYEAVGANPVHCDLLITLGSPLGDRHVTALDLKVWTFVQDRQAALPETPSGPPKVGRWINYWALRDVISGKIVDLPPGTADNRKVDPTYFGDASLFLWLTRTVLSAPIWHWYDSLQSGSWIGGFLQPDNSPLREQVAAEINQVAMSNISDACEPNNSPTTPCGIGGIVDRYTLDCQSIGPNDEDWFRFYTIQRSTSVNFVQIDFTHAQGDLDMCVCPGGNCENQLCSNGTGNSETVSLNGLLGGEFLVRVFGFGGDINPEYTLTIVPPSDACRRGEHLSIDNMVWRPSSDDGDTIVECGETANVRMGLCSSSTVLGVTGTLIVGGDEIDLFDPDVQYGTISPNSCENGYEYRMRVPACDSGSSVRGTFALLLNYSKDGFHYCQVIPNIFKDFPYDVQPGEFAICDVDVHVDASSDCDGDGVWGSGEWGEIRVSLSNNGFAGVEDPDARISCDLGPGCSGLTVDCGPNENIRYPDLANDSSCHFPERATARWDVEAPKNFAGTCDLKIKVDYDGATETFEIPEPFRIHIQSQGWLDILPHVIDVGVASSGEQVTVQVAAGNPGTAETAVDAVSVDAPPGMGVTVMPVLPWSIAAGGSLPFAVSLSCDDYEGPFRIRLNLDTDSCYREGRNRVEINGFCSGPCPPRYEVPGVTGASFPDVSGDWIVWTEARFGNPDIFAFNVCTNQQLQVTDHAERQLSPKISGNLICWNDLRVAEVDPEYWNIDVYCLDLDAPELGEISLAHDGWSERIIGVDGNRVAMMRDYHVFTERTNVEKVSNLVVYDYLGNGSFSELYNTGFASNTNLQPMQSISVNDGTADFNEGMICFERFEAYWETEFAHLLWNSRASRTECIDFAAGWTDSRQVCPRPARSILATAAHRYAYYDSINATDEQGIWVCTTNGIAEPVVVSTEFEPGNEALAIGGQGGNDYIVYDYNDAERPFLFYMDRAQNDERVLHCDVSERVTQDNARIDGTTVVWTHGNGDRKVNYAFLGNDRCTSNSDCDDRNACTTDVCDSGCCSHVPNCSLDTDCDDGLFCNGAEICSLEGCCQPGTKDCDDGVGCTADSCNEDTDSCDNNPNDILCANGLYCDGVEWCDPVNDCQPGEDVNCSDRIDCTDDSCNEDTDECERVTNDSNCDDGLFCNGDETCDPASGDPQTGCRPGTDPCPDGIPCTSDDCDDELDECPHDLTPDTCLIGGSCYPNGTANPFNECEVCDSAADPRGWTPKPPDTPCGDPNDTTCDNPNTCDGAGTCEPNNEPNETPCDDDGIECTKDVCTFGVCGHPNEPGGTACGDPMANECTAPDSCDDSGICLDNHMSTGMPCGDDTDDDCTNPDTCSGDGECLDNHEPDGTSCEDGLLCNGVETCQSGACVPGEIPCLGTCTEDCHCLCETNDDCPDDGLSCTSAVCRVDGCCEVVIVSGSCSIDGLCYADGDRNPGNDCMLCDPGSDARDWSLAPIDTPCGSSVDDACTAPDTCDGAGTCEPNDQPNGSSCNDGESCTSGDACSSGSCVGTQIPCCGVCCPECAGRECGDDGCGGSCGTCIPPATCNTTTGQCEIICEPACGGRECGDDGCGGSCGTCPDDGLFCTGNPVCENGACGFTGDPCAGDTPVCCESSDSCIAECCDDADCGPCNVCEEGDCRSQCDGDQVCDGATCVRPCGADEDCRGRLRCVADACTKFERVPAPPGEDPTSPQSVPHDCNSDDTCATPADTCVDGYCLQSCPEGNECGDDESCEDGSCWTACIGSEDCPETQFCADDGSCKLGCRDDSDCDQSQFCKETCVSGTCQPGNAPCSAGQTCNEDEDCCQVWIPPSACGGCGDGAWVCVMIGSFAWLSLRFVGPGRRSRTRRKP